MRCAAAGASSILLKLNAMPATLHGMRCGDGRLHKSTYDSTARNRFVGGPFRSCGHACRCDGVTNRLLTTPRPGTAYKPLRTAPVQTVELLPTPMIRPGTSTNHSTSSPRDAAQVVCTGGENGLRHRLRAKLAAAGRQGNLREALAAGLGGWRHRLPDSGQKIVHR